MMWNVKYDRFQWHRWFAWRPVRTADGAWIWLETVERVFYRPWIDADITRRDYRLVRPS